MNTIAKFIIILLTSFFLVVISRFLQSNYINDFLSDNLFLICIAIFTIHTSSSAILISQLNILSKTARIDFTPTLKAIKNSFIEEVFIIFFVILTSVVNRSRLEVLSREEIKMGLAFIHMSLIFAQLWIIYDVLTAILDSFTFTTSGHNKNS